MRLEHVFCRLSSPLIITSYPLVTPINHVVLNTVASCRLLTTYTRLPFISNQVISIEWLGFEAWFALGVTG